MPAVPYSTRPAALPGPLLVAAGAASFVGAFGEVAWDLAGDLAARLTWLYVAVIGHVVLTQPDGRLEGRRVGPLVAGIYLLSIVTPADDPLPLALGLAAAIGARRLLLGSDPRRGWADLTGLLIAAGLATGPLLAAVVPGLPLNTSALPFAAVATAAFVLATDAIRFAPARSRVTDVVLRLTPGAPTNIAAELRRATGDPTLEVGFPLAGGDGYADVAGRRVSLPVPGSGRIATTISRDGEVAAVVVHDRRLETDAALEAATARAAELATANARLQAELRARVAEVHASRRRIVEAGDEERRALEHRLATGLVPELDDLARRLDDLGAGPDESSQEALDRAHLSLAEVRQELGRQADGLHPRALETSGLADALSQLAARGPVPVALDCDGLPPLPPAAGATAWYVCSEALANVAKHARATLVEVSVTVANGTLALDIADDGVGGAEPDGGTGLRGLVDRVEAMGGSLRIDSAPGSGTRLRAVLPMTAS